MVTVDVALGTGSLSPQPPGSSVQSSTCSAGYNSALSACNSPTLPLPPSLPLSPYLSPQPPGCSVQSSTCSAGYNSARTLQPTLPISLSPPPCLPNLLGVRSPPVPLRRRVTETNGRKRRNADYLSMTESFTAHSDLLLLIVTFYCSS